jgi:hypothetical protein
VLLCHTADDLAQVTSRRRTLRQCWRDLFDLSADGVWLAAPERRCKMKISPSLNVRRLLGVAKGDQLSPGALDLASREQAPCGAQARLSADGKATGEYRADCG